MWIGLYKNNSIITSALSCGAYVTCCVSDFCMSVSKNDVLKIAAVEATSIQEGFGSQKQYWYLEEL